MLDPSTPVHIDWETCKRSGKLVVGFSKPPPAAVTEDPALGDPLISGWVYQRLLVRFEHDQRSQPSGRFDHAISGDKRAPTPAEVAKYKEQVLTWLGGLTTPVEFVWGWSGAPKKVSDPELARAVLRVVTALTINNRYSTMYELCDPKRLLSKSVGALPSQDRALAQAQLERLPG